MAIMAKLGVKKIMKERRIKTDVDGEVCSVHGKKRKAEYLVDDDKGGMCCAPGDECKNSKEASADKPARKGLRGKVEDIDPAECKWCEKGECWSHGQIEKPERKGHGRGGKKDDEMGMCSVHGKKRAEASLIDGCCAPGEECQLGKDAFPNDDTEQVKCSEHGSMRTMQCCVDDDEGGYKCGPHFRCKGSGKGGVGGKHGGGKAKGKAKGKGQAKGKAQGKGRNNAFNTRTPTPEQVRAAIAQKRKGGKGGKGGRR